MTALSNTTYASASATRLVPAVVIFTRVRYGPLGDWCSRIRRPDGPAAHNAGLPTAGAVAVLVSALRR
jgi:hypothetical protein